MWSSASLPDLQPSHLSKQARNEFYLNWISPLYTDHIRVSSSGSSVWSPNPVVSTRTYPPSTISHSRTSTANRNQPNELEYKYTTSTSLSTAPSEPSSLSLSQSKKLSGQPLSMFKGEENSATALIEGRLSGSRFKRAGEVEYQGSVDGREPSKVENGYAGGEDDGILSGRSEGAGFGIGDGAMKLRSEYGYNGCECFMRTRPIPALHKVYR